MSRCPNCIAAMKELNLNDPNTKTSAASNESQNPAPVPSPDKTEPAKTLPAKTPPAKPLVPPKPAKADPATDTGEDAASPLTDATGHLSQRIARPVPHRVLPEPGSVEDVLKSPADAAPQDSPLRHLSGPRPRAKQDASDQDASGVPAKTASGGFSGVNNWLDSLPEPNLERLGDKIYAAPSTFKKRWQSVRIERAKAAELKEQERLLEVARAEAQAEAAKRESARLARQAAADAAARRANEERMAAQKQAEASAKAAEEARLRTLAPPPAEYPEPASSPAYEEPALHAGNLVPRTEPDPAEQDAPGDDTAAAGSGTPIASTAAPRLDPGQLAALVASAKAAIDQQRVPAEPVYEAPYVLPETGPNPAGRPTDVFRRILGGGAALAAAAVSLANLETLSSGKVESLGSNYSLLSLAPSAHLLWPVIFVWAVLAAAYSWAPSQRSAVRQRAVGLRFALACAGNALWMLSALNGWLFPAFGFAAASCWYLYTAVLALNLHTARTRRERIFTDAPVSLMTGFSLVVLASTLTNMLQSWGAGGAGLWFATVLVPALGYGATTLGMTERGRIILAIGFGWGMFWLLVPRVLGTNNSIWVAVLAGMAGFVVLLATENRRYQIHHAEHRAARGKPTDFS